jgi:hypothetical protein
MDILIDKVFEKIRENNQVADLSLSVNELSALETVAFIFSEELTKVRESAEKENKDIDIEDRIFIDSLISAYNKLNNCEMKFV